MVILNTLQCSTVDLDPEPCDSYCDGLSATQDLCHKMAHLNVFLVGKERCSHDVTQEECIRIHIKGMASEGSDAIPVTRHHSPVGHHLQERAAFTEVIDLLLQVHEGLPFLKGLGQLSASATGHWK